MRFKLFAAAALLAASSIPALSGEAEVRAAQTSIEAQLKAFAAGENEAAYSYAAPNVKRTFPTLEKFMSMVENGYQPVWKPKNYAFGESTEMSPTAIIQKVIIVGADGKDYEAIYTLEQQEDGTFRISGVSLRGAKSLGV